MADKLEPVAYTIAQAAQVANVSRPTMHKWSHLEGFPVARIGGCVRIPAQAFRLWLEKQAGVTENV